VERAGLAWQGSDGFALDYARTLDEWQTRFQAAWPAIQAMGFDARFKRMWEQYLWYCEAGFKTGCIDVVQATVARE
jgi:cyclopropane-fatty-acyl-phospholipid synthase